MLIQHTYRPRFPNIWTGREADFDKASILAVKGEKHRSLRGAWTPMFFTGRHAQPQAPSGQPHVPACILTIQVKVACSTCIVAAPVLRVLGDAVVAWGHGKCKLLDCMKACRLGKHDGCRLCMRRNGVQRSGARQGLVFTAACSLEAYSALMNEATDLLLASIGAAAKEGSAFDIHKAVGEMTLQVVGTTAFGCAGHSLFWFGHVVTACTQQGLGHAFHRQRNQTGRPLVTAGWTSTPRQQPRGPAQTERRTLGRSG